MLSGRLSPSRFIFSLLNETFITQVCGLKNNECCCFRKTCINHKPGEAKHEIKTSVLVKAIWAHLGGGVRVTGTRVPLWDPQELTASLAFSATTHVTEGLLFFAFQRDYLLNTQSHVQECSFMSALPVLFSDFSSLELCNLPLSPHHFSKHISAELWVCIM